MQVYLVGGAVRNQLLGLPITEHDWVVVGSTPEEMTTEGFQPVGKNFPVFLHPKTHEEYALARTERKTGKGYKGFTFHTSPYITLEEDLKRRDLTINAIAKSAGGKLIDPYGGQQDIEDKIFRHVSEAFQEDPVRILRVARFAAMLPQFTIHPDTLDLMKHMVEAGEASALVSERVWQEFYRALKSETPIRFFEVLEQCNALRILFPNIATNNQGLKKLPHATKITTDAVARYAIIVHDLAESHLLMLSKKYRVPNEMQAMASLVNRFYPQYAQTLNANPEELLKFVLNADGLRRPERFKQFLNTCGILYDGNSEKINDYMTAIVKAVQSVNAAELIKEKLTGPAFAQEIKKRRLSAIIKLLT